MWNRRCLLYVIVIVLAACETSSINDRNYRGRKSNFEKLNKVNETVIRLLDRNFEGKKNKTQDESFVKDVEHEVLTPDSTSRNGSGKLATGTVSTLNNSGTSKRQNSHEQQSHSNKRHFHRSKIYRKEGRSKQHGNATKRTGTLLGISSKEIFRNLTSSRKRESAKLMISESKARKSRPESLIRTNDDFILVANSSLNGSRELYSFNKTKLQDEISSKISGFTSNDRSNSSAIEDKSSSVKLTTSLNFEPRFNSTSKQEVTENSSNRPKLLTESEYRSIDESEKIFGDGSTNLIPTSVKPLGNYSVIHGRISADNYGSAFLTIQAKPKNESSFSPESSDDSLDRISLAGVIDQVLKNVGWSENFLLQNQNSSSNTDSAQIYPNPSEVEIGSAKHSRSLKDPENIDESPISEDSLPNHAEDIDQPFKLSVPLNFEVFIDNETEKGNSESAEIFLPVQFSTKSFPKADSTKPESAEFGKTPNPRMVIKNASIEGQNIPSSSDVPISVTEIDEPVVRESFTESDETKIDSEGIENFFGELENRNASSLSPSFDGYSVETASKEFREKLNVSTTTEPENFYIIEGFRFFKNIDEESPESEEDLERNDAVSIDYGDTEIYPQIEGFFPSLKDIDRIEPETKEEAAVIIRKGNFGVRREDTSWWSNPDGKEAQKDVREIQNSADEDIQQRIESASSNRILSSNPGIYAIGICLIVLIGGFSLWCSRTSSLFRRRRTTLPKMNRFVQQRGEMQNTVV